MKNRAVLPCFLALAVLGSGCADWRRSGFIAAKNLGCQSAGGSAVECSGTYSDDYRTLQRESQ